MDALRAIAERCFAGLAGIPGIEPPPHDDADFHSSWHRIRIGCDRRDDLSVHLWERGIRTGVHYTPIHTYSCYGNRPHLPVAEELAGRILTLPLYPDLADADVDRVVAAIRQFYES